MVTLQNQSRLKNLNTEGLSSLEVKGYGVKNKISKFDMSFTFVENDVLGLVIEYNTDIYDAYLAERMFSHLENILSACVSDPEMSIEKIDYITASEREELLNGFNNTKADYPADKTIIDLFEQQVLKSPDNVALVFGDTTLT
ncbi:condensation domain-containing protein, partial [[Flexibacter] sp. ATCC 35103]|uniref:condensation domain-containing protein n=1 Tax=[Flexibacter] sp. ATCC 35103 TaxID=1937528 RepID=UPI002101CA09